MVHTTADMNSYVNVMATQETVNVGAVADEDDKTSKKL